MKSHIAPLIYIASLVSLTLQTPVTLNQTLSRSEDVAQSIPIAEPTRAGEVLNHTEQIFVTSTLEVVDEESNDEIQLTKNRIEVETLEEKNLVEETLRLIDEGDRRIPFDPNIKDVILVVGNTGAGKTTITKFIAELSDLEAYDAGDRFLIRDKDHKISENSTMVSQTIFPDLIVDTETNDTFYDLPGFADTRNASVEIANAWFMKRVADNSERVKLLFIVNYGSVLSGTTRTGFKTFLQQAAKLVKTPAKFKSAISLVATKVESSRTPDRIINGIAMFLNGIKTDLPEVISDDMERQTAEELIDTILTQDSNGTYTKISFFRQPDEEGPIHQIPSVMSQRPHILNMVFNNTNYTRSVPEDFGISLSPKAILLLTKVVAKINQDLAGDFKVITLQWSANYRNSIEMAPLNTLGEQLTKQNKIEVTISTLSSSNSREDFLQSFDIISSPSYMKAASNGTMQDTIVRMGNRLKHLEFFEKSLGQNFSAPISEWAFPFTEFLQELKNATAKQAAALNDQIDQQCLQLGSALTSHFKGCVQNTEVQIQKMELTLSILTHGHQKLMEMVSALEKSTTINGFVGTVKQNIHELVPTLETSNLIHLTEDVKMDDEKASLPFSLVSWLSPFYKLTKYVSEQVSMMKIGIQNEKHRIEREEAERRRRMEEEERERQRIAREEQEKREREEAERRRVEHEERMRIEREAQAREALRRQQEYMDLLWRQRRRSSRGGFGQGFNIGFTFRF